jgi:hypothetical protein
MWSWGKTFRTFLQIHGVLFHAPSSSVMSICSACCYVRVNSYFTCCCSTSIIPSAEQNHNILSFSFSFLGDLPLSLGVGIGLIGGEVS